MQPSLKAALLSGLVFPGLGQIYLQRYRRGIGMIMVVIAGLGSMIGVVTARVTTILETMPPEIGGNPGDLVFIINRALAPSSNRASLWYMGGLVAVVGCWLFALIDAYRLGRKKRNHT